MQGYLSWLLKRRSLRHTICDGIFAQKIIRRQIKDDFNEEYGKLSRTKRLTDGFRDWEDNA